MLSNVILSINGSLRPRQGLYHLGGVKRKLQFYNDAQEALPINQINSMMKNNYYVTDCYCYYSVLLV